MKDVRYYVARDIRWERCNRDKAEREVRNGQWIMVATDGAIAYGVPSADGRVQWRLVCDSVGECRKVGPLGCSGMRVLSCHVRGTPCAAHGRCSTDEALEFLTNLVSDMERIPKIPEG